MDAPQNVVRRTRRRTTTRTINAATAADAVGPITPGIEMFGLSKGQFSLVELMLHCLDTTGPADLTISTWTAAGADLEHTHQLLTDGRVRSVTWLVDYSFPRRQPGYCQRLRALFGGDCIRTTANHAKFIIIRNESWSLTIRTSMNLNLNRRLESFEVSDDPMLADYLLEVIADAFTASAATIDTADDTPGRARATVTDILGPIDSRAGITHTDAPAARPTTGISYD